LAGVRAGHPRGRDHHADDLDAALDRVLGAKLVAAVTTAFLLGAASLNHAIVVSLLMFAALHTGHAPFGYLDRLATAVWAALGNIIGGVGLVTSLRLLQVPHRVEQERRSPAG
jgi:formate/nitrite transporter FocA (FNT family)